MTKNWNERDDNITFEKYERNIIWSEDNHYVDDKNISLLMQLKDITAAKKINHYDGHMHPDDAAIFLEACTDEVMVDTCDALCNISYDFHDDMSGWAKHMNGDTWNQIGAYNQDPKVCRKVMSMCGAGYTRLFVMFAKVLEKPDIIFLTNPTTSLHPVLSEAVLSHLKYMSEDTKFMISASDGFVSLDERYIQGICK